MSIPTNRRITVAHGSPWALYRKGLQQCLQKKSDIEFIGGAADSEELLRLIEYQRPDVVILDIQLPNDGIETITLIKHSYPSVKIIVLTIISDPDYIIRSLQSGASAYLTTDAGCDDIYNAVKASFGHGVYCCIGVNRSSDRSFKYLNAKEIKIIKLLEKNCSEDVIAGEIDLSPRTVRALIGRLKQISGTSSNIDLIMEAKEQGFIDTSYKTN